MSIQYARSVNDFASNPSGQRWHSNDFLLRAANNEVRPSSSKWVPDRGEFASAADTKFGAASLGLLAADPDIHERASLQRSTAYVDRDLVVFGARVKSTWVLDVLAGRLTRYAYDWTTLRAVILRSTDPERGTEKVLDEVPLDRLTSIVEVLHERSLDPEAERALLRYMAARIESGSSYAEKKLEPFVERLLQAGLGDQARALLPRLKNKNWVRHAFTTELEHPRFGGSFEGMLALLNEPYRRLGLEPLTLDASADTPFHRLDARPQGATVSGPLVTVIMTCWCPDVQIMTAVRSIIGQTYQNWELILTDDASPIDVDPLLKRVGDLDPRIRVVRNEVNAGTYVRRNEAIQSARGEFVTVQDSDDWSHPRRLEIQVADLQQNPMRLANVVHAARITEEFSVISNRGARLFVAEPSLMFRREPVTAAVGYYDSIRKSADTEFRKRLEAATKRPIPALLPGAPLKLMLADSTSLSGADFGTNIWNHPDRLTYWSATHRFLNQISSGEHDPYLPFPLPQRAFHAPVSWSSANYGPEDFDLIVVLDGRESAERADFHETVAEELEYAASGGLRVAIVQSDSLTGPHRAMAFFPSRLQELVDSGMVARVGSTDGHRAKVIVVRHAGAAQGHPAEPLSLYAQNVVIVEDDAAGDKRGKTISQADVGSTVEAWFGVEPTWTHALPTLPTPSVTLLDADDTRVRVVIATTASVDVRAIHLTNGEHTLILETEVASADTVIGAGASKDLIAGDWSVSVEFDAGDGRIDARPSSVGPDAVIWNSQDRLIIRTEAGGVRILTPTTTSDLPGSRDYVAEYLSATVGSVRVIGEKMEVTVTDEGASSLAAVYALREADNAVIRRREFSLVVSREGRRRWERELAKFSGSPWRLVGTFRTPLGDVEYPFSIDSTAELAGTDVWQPRVLPQGRLTIVPRSQEKTVPQPKSAALGLPGKVVRRLRKLAHRSTATPVDAPRAEDEVRFTAKHAESRLPKAPVLSVVMPVYNVEPFLDAAIVAVLGQDFSDLELIIVDDASTDKGSRIIAEYWKKDPRVRVFALNHNTIGGAGVPSNIGIRAALGRYVAFADSDDQLTDTGLANMVRLAEAHSAELVIGDFRTFSDRVQEGSKPYDREVWTDLPLNRPISAFSHPALFRLSPVPWRKLYRRDFLETHSMLYPEGDYFYEDNPLHWFVLSRAHTVVVTDEVISFHRMEREGQTMSAQAYKLGAFVSHANTILNFLTENTDKDRDVLFASFFGYLDRSHWTVKNQTQPAAAALLRRGLGDVFQKAVTAAPNVPVPTSVRPRLVTYGSAYPDVDLTVVVPVFNSADLLKQTMNSVLAIKGISFNVLLVDDGSTDDSLAVLRDYENRHSNVHVFAQGNRGAGRARNSVIPLCTGRYTFFLDADDLVDAGSLAAAVQQADADDADLLFVKYRIEFTDEKRSQGMFTSDRELWNGLAASADNDERQKLVARLINYPWNRIIRTSLLHDANIFFGPTVVHNDVLFHWHSVVSAKRISYLDAEVCTHRKFATRQQVTNISDARRMAVLEALRATHQRISLVDAYPNVEGEWKAFALHLIDWAKGRIPEDLQRTYAERSAELRAEMDASDPVVA